MISLVQSAAYLAWADTKARYKNSVLGPIWPTLTTFLGVLGLGLVWGHIMNQDMKVFIPQLTVGLIVWQLISGVLVESPTTFVRRAGIIKNVAIPSWFFVVRALAKHLINLLHNLIIIVGVLLYYHVHLTANFWLFLPGLLLVILNLYWIMFGVGFLGARFRDLEPLILSVVPILFFISPVLYRADRIAPGFNLVWLNPFSYMIEAVRSPLLGFEPHEMTYPVLIGFLFLGGGFTWVLNKMRGRRLAFWV